MLNCFVELKGNTQTELNTELRFCIAGARADNSELVSVSFENQEIDSMVKRILNKLKREGLIQFYVAYPDINARKTESEYLINKYQKVISAENRSVNYYVKL